MDDWLFDDPYLYTLTYDESSVTSPASPVQRMAKLDYQNNRHVWAYEFLSQTSAEFGNYFILPFFVLSPTREYVAFTLYNGLVYSFSGSVTTEKGWAVPIINDRTGVVTKIIQTVNATSVVEIGKMGFNPEETVLWVFGY